jgi:hypothetical protein
MALRLEELQESTRVYIETQTRVTVSNFRPDVGPKLNRNEGFSFDIEMQNLGSIGLVNLRVIIRVANPAIAKLIVPPLEMGSVHTAFTSDSPTVPPGTEVQDMILFPRFDTLLPNGQNSFTKLRGKAHAGGSTNLEVEVLAEPDIHSTFRHNTTPLVIKPLGVFQ